MNRIVKIKAPYLFCLLFLTRLLMTLTYIPALSLNLFASDVIMQVLLCGVFVFITSIPIMIFIKRNTNANILDRCGCMSKVYAKMCALVYIVDLLNSAVVAIARFDIFATSVMFPQTDFRKFLIVFILACMIALLYGIEALCRASALMLVFVLISIGVVLVSVTKEFDFLNFTPMFYNGLTPILKAALVSTATTSELRAILLLLPMLEGNLKKGMIWWIISVHFFIIVMLIFMEGVMGEFSRTQIFPMYNMTVLAKLKLFQRLDVILTGSWIICFFADLTIDLYLIKVCLQTIFTKKYNNVYIIIEAIALCVVSFFLTPNAYSIKNLLNPYIDFTLYCITIVVIPVTVLIYEKIRNGKKNEN